jgi:hypothetical protein
MMEYFADLLYPIVEQYGLLSVVFMGVIIGFLAGNIGGWIISTYRNRAQKTKEPSYASWDDAIIGDGEG